MNAQPSRRPLLALKGVTQTYRLARQSLFAARPILTVLDGIDPAPEVFLTSSQSKAGRTDLLRFISARL